MQRFLTANWQKLIMANYEIDATQLKTLIPAGTEADTWNGNTYVSLVGFLFGNTRVRGWRIPFHVNFPEVNLRFYVRYKENHEWKRGVVFVKEIVPRPAITFVANSLFNERYITLPMKYSIQYDNPELAVSYHWKYKNAWHSLSAQANTAKQPLVSGSKEEFITEHFWGYSSLREGITGEYRVEHPRWDVYPVQRHEVHCDFESLYGKQFGGLYAQQPVSVFLAEGSEVAVYKKRIIPPL
jgi:uncharacterized protein YqjF (DUF2071 family)